MTSDLDLRGVWVPLITPFDAADAVDVDAIERLCHEYLAAGAAGIVALGHDRRVHRARRRREARGHRRVLPRVRRARAPPLIVGTGTNNTRTTIAATQALAEVPGVVGALVVVPYYVRPSEAGIVAHMQTVADASVCRSSCTTSRTAPVAD